MDENKTSNNDENEVDFIEYLFDVMNEKDYEWEYYINPKTGKSERKRK